MDWMEFVLSVVAGLTAAIPLVVKLVEYVRMAVQAKNWYLMLDLLTTYMKTAETMFETGAEKKEWVLAMIKASANTVNFEIDLDVIGKVIDDLCYMSKIVNPPAAKAGE